MEIEVTLVFPLHDNEGTSLALQRESAKARILEIAGGYSAYLQNGAWLDAAGKKYEDTSERVVTVCSDEPFSSASFKVMRLNTLAHDCVLTMRQKAIFFQVREVSVEFVTSASIPA